MSFLAQPDAQQNRHQLPVLHDSEAAGAAPGPRPLLTPARQAEFCERLAQHGNVRLACRALGISSQTAYRARRASAQMRACWDAALVIARQSVEEVLADRAINGVEESVFYHGEEVATRRRYDSRLLLAHLARLDAKAERLAACSACDAPLEAEAGFDAALERLGELPEGQSGEGQELPPGLCSMCSTLARNAAPAGAPDAQGTADRDGETGAGAGAQLAMSPAPVAPCPDCGGFCEDADQDDRVPLTEADCMWQGNRLDRMEAARPEDAPTPRALAAGDFERGCTIELLQLLAFEQGVEQWWLVAGEADLAARLDAQGAAGG
ncbi:hypothetical protein [Erythrobacter alti]|uniref:hypothetical protein n=1 Tax=Erythrobacter alti TaxID=1896145 RepID=UPI0030F473F8